MIDTRVDTYSPEEALKLLQENKSLEKEYQSYYGITKSTDEKLLNSCIIALREQITKSEKSSECTDIEDSITESQIAELHKCSDVVKLTQCAGTIELPHPIMVFSTNEELKTSLTEWQERLFLNHWNIKAYLVHGDEIKDMSGDSNVQWVNSCGTIRIRYANEMPEGMIEKEPHEKVLVHELLHFKYMGYSGDSIESVFFDEKQHQLLEQMAKSLIMSKYGISYEWFKN